MKERVSVTPKILELQNSNDIYMTMNIVILSEDVNFNNAQFELDFIDGVVENKEKYIGLPFLVNREKLENGDVDRLTHELDSETGELKTDQIGSFVDFWKDEVDGADCLLGSIRIFKRFYETCSVIVDLVENDSLETSCEVLVNEYSEVSDDGVRKIHYNAGKNALIGSAIVTNGAEKRAKPTLLIAEAYEKDIQLEHKGGEKVGKKDKIETFNKGVEIKFVGNLETSSLTWYDVQDKVYNILNPVDTKNGGRDYNYWIAEVYTDSVIFAEWDGEQLYRSTYTIDGETVTLAPEEDWVKGSFQFVPEGVTVNELISENDQKITGLQKELSKLKEEKKTMAKENELSSEDLQEKIDELEEEVAKLKEKNEELEATIVSLKEDDVESAGKIEELSETIEGLKVYKEKVEQAEKDAKIEELSDKFSKILDEEVFKSEEVVKAINELDETALNSIVVAELAKAKSVEVSSKSDDVVISASEQKDLVESAKDTSYWSAPAK